MATENLPIEDALDFLVAEAMRQGADKCDAVATESQRSSIHIYQRQSSKTQISHSHNIELRLWKQNCPGRASTERFSREALQRTVRDALGHSQLTDAIPVDLPSPRELPDIDLRLYAPEVDEIGLDRFHALGLELEEHALSGHPSVENVPGAVGSRNSSRTLVGNSLGVRYSARHNLLGAHVHVVTAQGDSKKSSGYGKAGHAFEELDAARIAAIAVERGVELLGAAPVPSGQYPIVFSNRVGPRLLRLYTSNFYAEQVQKGQSRLVDKIGTIIAAPIVTLVSNPHLPGEPGSRLFDSEGVPGQVNHAIEQGVLKTYFYNLESAHRAGCPPNGNGPFNWWIARGTQTLPDLLAAYPHCLYITGLEGSSGCSATSGEISIGAEGFLYEQGRRVRPIDQITVSGNFFDLLHSIRGLSDEFDDTYDAFKTPDILVESMYVAG